MSDLKPDFPTNFAPVDNTAVEARTGSASAVPDHVSPITRAEDKPSLADAIVQSALLANTEANLADLVRKWREDDVTVDPNFDPYEFTTANKSNPKVAAVLPLLVSEDGDRLNNVANEGSYWRMVERLSAEVNAHDAAESHGIVPHLAGGIVGFVVSPSSWLGIGAGAKVGTGARMALGGRVGSVAGGVGSAVVESIPSEAVAYAAQELYSAKDAFLNLGISGAIGGAVGRHLSALDYTDPAYNPLRPSKLRDELLSSTTPPDLVSVPGHVDAGDALQEFRLQNAKSGGAAAVTSNGVAKGGNLGWAFDKWTPIGRTIRRSSENATDFDTHSRLYEVPVGTIGNEAGVATEASAELVSRVLHDTLTITRSEEVAKIYREMALTVFGEGKVTSDAKNLLGIASNRLTSEEFSEAITRYRRARSVIEEMGNEASPVAKGIVEAPHPDANVAGFIRRAAEVEDRYYDAWADHLQKRGLLSPEKRRKVYSPVVLNRQAVLLNEGDFRALLRDAFEANPPREWLEASYGKASLKDLDPAHRELALGEWVTSQRRDFERMAETNLKQATADLEAAIGSLRSLKRDATKAGKERTSLLVREARATERELLANREALSLEAAQRRAERDAMQRALDAGITRQNARAAQEVDPRPDAGSGALADLQTSLARRDRAEGNALAKLGDALSDPASAGRVDEAGDVAKALQRLDSAVAGAQGAERKAKVDPVEAAKAPSAEPTISTAVAEERLRAANARLGAIDREAMDAAEKLRTIGERRAALEARLSDLSETRKKLAGALRASKEAARKAGSAVAKAERRAKAADTGALRTAEERIDEVVDSILRGKDAPHGILREVVGESGRLKERKLFTGNLLADPRLEKFLVNDAEGIAERYARDLSPRIALRTVFGHDVDDALSRPLEELRSSWRERIAAATGKEQERLVAQARESEADFIAMRDKLMGRLGQSEDPASGLMWLNRNVRSFNVSRLMGMTLLSSLTDLATGALATKRLFAWVPLMGKRIGKIAAEMPDAELRALMIAAEQSQHSNRLVRSLGVDDSLDGGGFGTGRTYRVSASLDRGLSFLARNTHTLSGLRWWTSRMRFIFGAVQVQNMADELGRWGTLSTKERARWARLGVDEGSAARIAKQLAAHSEVNDGIRLPNGRAWTDADAYRRFQVALTRVMDEAVINPGAGDVPVFMSKPAGKLLMQFMSFAFASVNRFTRLAWQQRDINALLSVNFSLALGALGYVLREQVKGTDANGKSPSDRLTGRTVGDWFYEAFSRSPLPGHLTYGMDAITKLGTRHLNEALGVNVLTGPSRMRERQWWTTALGPSVGLAENLGGLVTSVLEGREKGSGPILNKAARLAPWGNLAPVLLVTEAAERELYGVGGVN